MKAMLDTERHALKGLSRSRMQLLSSCEGSSTRDHFEEVLVNQRRGHPAASGLSYCCNIGVLESRVPPSIPYFVPHLQ